MLSIGKKKLRKLNLKLLRKMKKLHTVYNVLVFAMTPAIWMVFILWDIKT